MMNYFEALGLVANPYYLIAIAGAHGKTTTTAMLIDMCEDAGLDPSAVVGSLRSRTGKNYRAGKSKYFIAEACEYKRDFLTLEPDILVITNVEAEHLDYYKDLDDVIDAFRALARKVPEEGFIVCNKKDATIARVTEGTHATLVDYTEYLDLLSPMNQPGMHNRMNAAAASAVAQTIGIAREDARNSVSKFAGTWRRFEYKGALSCTSPASGSGAPVYDDYGHHPTEILATLEGARELYPDKKIFLAYQPHTYSRTHALFDDFVGALSKADEVILLPIYAAREENASGVTSELLAEAVGESARAVHSSDEAVDEITRRASEEYVVLVMGAGDITEVTRSLFRT